MPVLAGGASGCERGEASGCWVRGRENVFCNEERESRFWRAGASGCERGEASRCWVRGRGNVFFVMRRGRVDFGGRCVGVRAGRGERGFGAGEGVGTGDGK